MIRRRLRPFAAAWRTYQIARVVSRNPRYVLVTRHLIVARHLLDKAVLLDQIRADKSAAIEAQEWERAASLRDRERALTQELLG